MVDVVCNNAVICTLSALVGFLVTDENIERLLFMYNFENVFLKFVDSPCFFLVNAALNNISVLDRRKEVHIGHYRFKLRSVTGGDLFVGCGVFNIFNTIFAKNNTPVRLRLGRVGSYNFIVNLLRLVKLTLNAKIVCAVEQVRHNIVACLGNSLLSPAILAFADGHSLGDFKVATAHFAFK